MSDDDMRNHPLAKVSKEAMKLARQRYGIDLKRKELNKEAMGVAENVEKLGIHPTSFRQALAAVKFMTRPDRESYIESMEFMLSELQKNEAEVLDQTIIAEREARAERRAKRDAKSKETAAEQERRLSAPDNPRGDPKKGGAGGVDGKGKAKDAAAKPVEPKVTGRRGKKAPVLPEVPADDPEQAEGAAVLDGAIDRIKAGAGDNPVENDIPKSQSQIAAEKREAAKLN